MLGVKAKTQGWGRDIPPYIKSNKLGFAFSWKLQPRLIRSDYDLMFVRNATRRLGQDEVIDELPRMNAAATGYPARTQVMHPDVWNYSDPASLGTDNAWVVFSADTSVVRVSKDGMRAIAERLDLGWPFDE